MQRGGRGPAVHARSRLRGRVVVRQRGRAAATRPRVCGAGRPRDGSVARHQARATVDTLYQPGYNV